MANSYLFTRRSSAAPAQRQLGRDAGTIIGTSALGAAVGAAVDWGTRRSHWRGFRRSLGIIGVLVTRGHPSILYPEQILTFRIERR